MQEVPAWRTKHACGSCHNNGDGARALFHAMRLGHEVPRGDAGQHAGVAGHAEGWEREAGEPGTSDKKLARLQFAASLLAATEAGAIGDRRAPARDRGALAADQDADGAWRIEEQASLGSPVAYGPFVATWQAQRTLRADAAASRRRSRGRTPFSSRARRRT